MAPLVAFEPAAHTKIKRGAKRAVWDRKQIYEILDANMVASIGFAPSGSETYPTVLPTGYVRDGDWLLFHGKSSSALQKRLASGLPVCVSIFSLDGIVCAKSAMHHSVNYRGVVIYGRAEAVVDDDEKRRALDMITDGLTWAGRAAECRPMTEAEVAATTVTRLELRDGDVSCKVRAHPPGDDDADLAYPCWAGNVPLATVSLSTIDAPHNTLGIDPPRRAAALARPGLITPLADLVAKTQLPQVTDKVDKRWWMLAAALVLVPVFLPSLLCPSCSP
mmetsp:Transcript_20390/g.64082  ORF Transcript_20390/g.64082 Transcript_20390/m.64082 type:complete len:277 (-) Transcript_20390:236-1066(-)